MTKEVFLVASENRSKAENALRADDLVSRASLNIRSAPHLDIDEEGYFIIVEGTDEVVKKAQELLDKIAKKYEHKEKVLEKMKKQEDEAIEGFGNILG